MKRSKLVIVLMALLFFGKEELCSAAMENRVSLPDLSQAVRCFVNLNTKSEIANVAGLTCIGTNSNYSSYRTNLFLNSLGEEGKVALIAEFKKAGFSFVSERTVFKG